MDSSTVLVINKCSRLWSSDVGELVRGQGDRGAPGGADDQAQDHPDLTEVGVFHHQGELVDPGGGRVSLEYKVCHK